MITMHLFEEKKILTVSQLTSLLRGVIEENFEHLWVEGEVSNLSAPASGHLYFTLKDAGAALRCVMFRGSAKALRFNPADGMKLIIRGRLTVYDQRGDYQLIAEYMEPQGVGALQLAFQQLKERLAKEGLFAEERKRQLPVLPATIGIVTSPTGAAIHDILNILERRHAGLHILVAPVKVQGDGAGGEIAAAIKDLNCYPGVDVIIVARGGGSMEDLWAFNEEVVARAIFASKIPVISAVGHEVDFTIADFVADLRAPTPSAAAELVIRSKSELVSYCATLERRLVHGVQRKLSEDAADFRLLQRSLKGPELVIARLQQRVDDLQGRCDSMMGSDLSEYESHLKLLCTRLQHNSSEALVKSGRDYLAKLMLRVSASINASLATRQKTMAAGCGRLEALSPLAVLARGYAVVQKLPEGTTVKSVAQLISDDRIRLQMSDGASICRVETLSLKIPEKLD